MCIRVFRISLFLCWFVGLHGFTTSRIVRHMHESTVCHMAAAETSLGAPQLCSTLKKPSKVLTIGVEFVGEELSETELSIVSMQLRKSKVSAIWCTEIAPLKEFAKEQESARGDFPGPCPVIYFGNLETMDEAVENGASAVVLSTEDDPSLVAGCEIVWKVASAEDIQQVLEKTEEKASAFLVEGGSEDSVTSIVEVLPKSALVIAALDSMQPDGAEVTTAGDLKKQGVASILVRKACIGDEEDLEYAQFLVGGMTSKASSEFKFSGLTGSTNGHFGGVQSNSSMKWRRLET